MNNCKLNDKDIYDVIIIGAGPAGLTAAIYAKRANLKTAIYEKYIPGGKVAKTAFVENYSGYEKIEGPSLATNFYNHAINLGVEIFYEEVIDINKKDNIFYIKSNSGMIQISKTVILSTGTVERKLNIPGEEEFYGKGLSYCAICDGSFYKNQDVAIIGGGNSAFEESLFLSSIVKKVYLIHRNKKFRADQSVIDRVYKNNKIELILDTIVTRINGDKSINEIEIENVLNNKKDKLQVKAVFPMIGFDSKIDFLKNISVLNNNSFLIVDENMSTNIPGLFSAGDNNDKHIRQISTAISDGTIAALSCKKYIDDSN